MIASSSELFFRPRLVPDTSGAVAFWPMGLLHNAAAQAAIANNAALPLLGGRMAATAITILWREPDGAAAGCVLTKTAFDQQGLVLPAAFNTPRAPWAGLSLDRPRIMGIINATPDSFSDGGDHDTPSAAINAALRMMEAGAHIIDVGGESTRPGAAPVSIADEIARVIPIIQDLAHRGICVSIDTRHAAIMQAATQAGAAIINDVAALTEPDALATAARSGAAICLMHMQGQPGTMQNHPHYDCAPLDVLDFLSSRVNAALSAGIPPDKITIDPGIGFGKTLSHNTQILSSLSLLHGLGVGILLGVSRKRFIAALSADEAPKARTPGSLSAALAGVDAGAQLFRVHDVAETVQAVKVWGAVR